MQYVYLLRAGESHYKVGVAKSVKKRLAGLQTSNPVKVEIVSTKLLDDAYATERALHLHLKEWNVSGEWFNLEPEQVIELLIEISKYPEPDLANNIRLRDILASQTKAQKRIEQKLRIVTDLAIKQLESKKLKPETTEDELLPEPIIKLTDEDIYEQALAVVTALGRASTSSLQLHLRIGYGRAARIMQQLEKNGVIGEADGARPREVFFARTE